MWPRGSTFSVKSDDIVDIDRCRRCKERLDGGRRTAASSRLACRLVASMNSGKVDLASGRASTFIEYLDALAEVCQLFVRRRTNSLITSSGTRWSALAEHLCQQRLNNQVQRLGVETRRKVLQTAIEILDNWPRSFLAFTREAGLSEVHFSESLPRLPLWMVSVVDSDLRRQRRGLTAPDVQRRITELSNMGRPINAAELERAFGVSQAKAITSQLGRRTDATDRELTEMLHTTRTLVQPIRLGVRRSSTASMARSAAVILLAIMVGKELRDVAEISERELEGLLMLQERGLECALTTCLKDCLTIYRSSSTTARSAMDQQRDSRVFCLCRGTGNVRRSAQEFLRSTMKGMDPRLQRSPAVFKRAFESS